MSDKVLDLRKCSYAGADLRAKVLSGALMSDANYTGANLQVRVPPRPHQLLAAANAMHMHTRSHPPPPKDQIPQKQACTLCCIAAAMQVREAPHACLYFTAWQHALSDQVAGQLSGALPAAVCNASWRRRRSPASVAVSAFG